MSDKPTISRRFVAAGLGTLLGTTAVQAAMLRLHGGVPGGGGGGGGGGGSSLAIAGTPITSATQGSAYGGFSVAASGGASPYTYSIASGTLPTGLSINSTSGAVSGTPSGTGVSSGIVIRVTDNAGATADLGAFSINVAAAGAGITILDAADQGSPYTWLPPTYRDATIVMSPAVAQGDEAIDVQAVIGTPYSPTATTVTLTGTDSTWFDTAAGGKLIFKASTRGSVPRAQFLVLAVNASNANGSSESCTLWIWVPSAGQSAADGEIFVSFKSGNDSTGTGSVSAPFKHCPGSVDWTGASTTYTGGKTIIFEGVNGTGGPHETHLVGAAYNYSLDHRGTITRQHRYAFHGWKGQAKFTGAKSISGSWGAASSGDTFSNPSTANIEKATIGFTAEWWNPVGFGDTLGFLSQYPRPTDLTVNTDWQGAAHYTNSLNNTTDTSVGGMKGLPLVNVTSSSAPVHLFLPQSTGAYVAGNLSGGMAWVQDPKLDARFGNASVAYNANGIGMWFIVPCTGNNISMWPVLAYDVTTHRAFFIPKRNAITPAIYTLDTAATPQCDFGRVDDGSGWQTAYALLGSPYDIRQSQQCAYNSDGTAILAYRPNTNQCRIGQGHFGMALGNQPWVSVHQAWFERYSGGIDRTGASIPGGAALKSYSASNQPRQEVFGLRSHQCFSGDENPCLFDASGGSFLAPIFDRFHQSECQRGAGTVIASDLVGVASGTGPGGFPTKAEVLAGSGGKVRWWYFPPNASSRSLLYWIKVRGMELRENVIKDFNTVHGDGYPWYRDGAGTYNDHNVLIGELGDNVCRWRTTSDGYSGIDSSVSKSNWFVGCVILAHNQSSNTGLTLFSGEPGGLFESCILLRSPRDTDNTTSPCFLGEGGFANMTVQYSIMNGASMDATQTGWGGTPATWTFQNNGLTGNSFPADDAANGRRNLSNTTLSTQHSWDLGTIPTPWKAILQAGNTPGTVKIGPFHYV